MLALGKRTGYDIKQLADTMTRFFWGASYGQIYPELRRLERHGLIVGRSEPSGARPRTEYRLTDTGREALTAWLASDLEPTFEVRDEGMLKLFLSDAAPEQRLAIVRAIRERNERKLAALQTLAPLIADGASGPALTVELGIGCTQALIDWCVTAERRLNAARERSAGADARDLQRV
jgi:DNA-binding PadR family transcriptional regulator